MRHPFLPVASPDISAVEHASLTAWPALEEHYKGPFLLRHAGGFTKRANSAVLSHATDFDDTHITAVETWYAERARPCIFRIPRMPEHCGDNWARLDARLAARGYTVCDPSVVMTHSLATLPEHPAESLVRFLSGAEWLACECRLSNRHPGDQHMMEHILACNADANDYVALMDDATVYACGLGIRMHGMYAIFCIHTAPDFRRQGYGTALVCALLRHAASGGPGNAGGLRGAWLQALSTNAPALALYGSLGFTTLYPYWYRIRQ